MSTYWILFTLSSPIEDLQIMEITEPPETTEMSEFFDETATKTSRTTISLSTGF